MSSRERRKFDREFKLEAARLIVEGGRKISEVAQDLGIHENVLKEMEKPIYRGQRAFLSRKGPVKTRG